MGFFIMFFLLIYFNHQWDYSQSNYIGVKLIQEEN